MDYRKLFAEENENVQERYALAIDRIREIENENLVKAPYDAYFKSVARFLVLMDEVYEMAEAGALGEMSLDELEALNRKLYEDILGDNYEKSFANPEYAVATLSEVFGGILSFVYTEVRGMIAYAFEGRKVDMTTCAEMFVHIY